MRGSLDIGTNSTRLLILSKDEVIHQETAITRIGQGLKEYGTIQEEPLKRTIKVLKKYKEKLISLKVDDYHLVATSAMRDALNKDEVVERIKKETGFITEVISGKREAELSYLGATADFSGKNVVIDIGGGSTEVIFPNFHREDKNKEEIVFISINLGGVRLKDDPKLSKEIDTLFRQNIPTPTILLGCNLIGVGGTITTLAAIKLALVEYEWEKIHGFLLTIEEIKEINKKLESLPLEERKKVPGLEPERADIITYGIEILLKFMEQYKFKKIRVSDKDLLFALASQ